MKSDNRKLFNQQVSESSYVQFIEEIRGEFPGDLDFRIAETPIFIDKILGNKLKIACETIVSQISTEEFKQTSDKAILSSEKVLNENAHTSFLAIDFALTMGNDGQISPQLIELQGFPSLFGFQGFLGNKFKEFYDIPSNYSQFFNELTFETYVEKLKSFLLNIHDPQNVILLEVYPETQKTRLDFTITKKLFGVETVCLTKIKQVGRKLFREKNGQLIEIKRIYNRLIFDDLVNFPDLKFDIDFKSNLDVEWCGHPNWFFKISKYSLPFLKSEFIPQSFFLSDFDIDNQDETQFVLKPLFSFAGSGVKLSVSKEELRQIEDKENFLMQRKVVYHQAVESPSGGVKAEVRMLYIWPDNDEKPTLVTNLTRLSRGEMIGVRFNKDFDWVGGTVCFFEN